MPWRDKMLGVEAGVKTNNVIFTVRPVETARLATHDEVLYISKHKAIHRGTIDATYVYHLLQR